MSKGHGLRVLALVLAVSPVAGCGDFQDDFRPTPSPAPTSTIDPNATPTATPSCGGTGGVPGSRSFTWVTIGVGDFSPSGVFASTDIAGDQGNVGISFEPGSFCFEAGPVDEERVAPVRMVGPARPEDGSVILFSKLLLDGLCLRIYPATTSGELYCDGRSGQGVDTRLSAPSGSYRRDLPRDDVLEVSRGDGAPAGSMVLRFSYQLARTSQGEMSDPKNCPGLPDCPAVCPEFPECAVDEFFKNCYQPLAEGIFTTGTALVEKGDIDLQRRGDPPPPPGITGEPFDCANWQVGDGPGRLVFGLTEYDDLLVKDTATALRLSDR